LRTKNNFKTKVFLICLFGFSFLSYAQTCGFGCLGLSGFYGGYTQQKYNAKGLNDFLNMKLSTTFRSNATLNFENGKGLRVGGNIFRAKFDDYFFTAKAYYQFMSETQEVNLSNGGSTILAKYELKNNHWGIGLDFGIPVFSFLDFKVFEAGLNFYLAEFTEKLESGINEISSENYSNQKVDVGYYFGSGLILHLVKDYISVEATAVYSVFKINAFENESGSSSIKDSNGKDLLTNKGFSAVVQLNLGFPL